MVRSKLVGFCATFERQSKRADFSPPDAIRRASAVTRSLSFWGIGGHEVLTNLRPVGDNEQAHYQ